MAVTTPPPPVTPPPSPEAPFVKERVAFEVTRETIESTVVFFLALIVYEAIGYRVVVQQHVVSFDGLARLAHAYFVWWNAPPKLTAVGFVWPPIATLVFLPLAAIKPLATSLIGLTLMSAVFGAGTLVVLNGLLRFLRMPALVRYALVAAYGVNPMILDYSTNGMAEVVYLFFLALGLSAFLRWYLLREAKFLIIAGLGFSFGVLSRYEVIAWVGLLVIAITAVLIRSQVTREEVEGSLLAYLAPVAYAIGLWLFVNWLILGNPLSWLGQQVPQTVSTPQNTSSIGSPVPAATPGVHLGLGYVIGHVIAVNWDIFPLTAFVFFVLAASFVFLRDLMGGVLALTLAMNGLVTAGLMISSSAAGYLQLRYNMRSMPLDLVGVGWLYHALPLRRLRIAVPIAATAVALLTIPVTWGTMRTYPYQFLEQAFTRALATGANQEGTHSKGGYAVGIEPEQQAASWISTHVNTRDAILTDDAQSFPVMLLTGHPDWFADRIDHGDSVWLDLREHPWGRVRYALVSDVALNDLTLLRYPGMLTVGEPGFHQVYRNARWAIFSVDKHPPPTRRTP